MIESFSTVKTSHKRSASVRKLSDEDIKKTQCLPCNGLKRSIFVNKMGKYHTKRYTESMMLHQKDTHEEGLCEKVLQEYATALREAVG